MFSGIMAKNQVDLLKISIARYVKTIPDNELPFPGAAVVRSQIDQPTAFDGTILHQQCPASDGIDTHMA